MKKIDFVIRMLLGIGILFFGMNGFFDWFTPPEGPEAEVNFLYSLYRAGYVFPIVNTILIASGLSLLTNKFVSIGLIILAPIMLNIVLIHLVFNPKGALLGGIFFVFMVILYFTRRKSFSPLFK
ncbi:hypothetical protein LX95_00087 [Mesonia algae]|uniref:DoxX-like protein n=1 Tax=Mesonia algae TaxID=213248 RepID=A0A2W7IYL3_9FLAO|nr:hypothetical protein [Mesonia algae]PZW43763.1 hypothetical protein LX95_00087 [Mesonia algae]